MRSSVLLLLCGWGNCQDVFLRPSASSKSLRSHISNKEPHRDTFGNILNAHDGNIIQHNGKFWLVGTSYTHCTVNSSNACSHPYPINPSPSGYSNLHACGWTNNDFALYSSADMATWTLENPSVLPADTRPEGIYFRPKLLHNSRMGHFVLWFNYRTEGWDCKTKSPAFPPGNISFPNCHTVLGTAVADSPSGPYTLQTLPVLMGSDGGASYQHGDFAVFTDTNGDAYVMYNSYDHGYMMSVDRLSDDYTTSTRNNSGWLRGVDGAPVSSIEAPVMMLHNNTYYAIAGHLCCFCAAGSNAQVYTASSPLGPWHAKARNDIQKRDQSKEAITIPAQQSFVVGLPTALGETQYMWAGDRWQSAPDGFKSHDFMAWVPLNFASDGSIEPLEWVQEWSVDLVGSIDALEWV